MHHIKQVIESCSVPLYMCIPKKNMASNENKEVVKLTSFLQLCKGSLANCYNVLSFISFIISSEMKQRESKILKNTK